MNGYASDNEQPVKEYEKLLTESYGRENDSNQL